MENSLKGLLVSLTLIALFTTSILSFIAIFPQEQGVTFDDLRSNNTYFAIRNNTDFGTESQLTRIYNDTDSAFNQWDITQGYMGSNAIKQSSSANAKEFKTNILSTLILIATKLFNANSPIVYAISVIGVLSSALVTYLVIKFVRQGE